MSKTYLVDGIPAIVSGNRTAPRTFRLKAIPRKTKEKPYKSLSPRQRRALEIYVKDYGMDPKKKVQAGTDAGFSPSYARQAVDSLVKRKEIVAELEMLGINDSMIAKKIKEGLEATHPLSKEDKADFAVRYKYISEVNKLRDNYPSKKIQIHEEKAVLHLTADDVKALKEFNELRGIKDDTRA